MTEVLFKQNQNVVYTPLSEATSVYNIESQCVQNMADVISTLVDTAPISLSLQLGVSSSLVLP